MAETSLTPKQIERVKEARAMLDAGPPHPRIQAMLDEAGLSLCRRCNGTGKVPLKQIFRAARCAPGSTAPCPKCRQWGRGR